MSISAQQDQYAVIPLTDEHRDNLIKVWNTNLLTCNGSTQRYQWLYEENPLGTTRTWLLKTTSDKIIGCGSLCPRRLFISGHSIPTLTAADFAVNKEHRSLGPALALMRAIVKHGMSDNFFFIFGNPNEAARVIVKRIGYKFIGEESHWTKSLRMEITLRKFITLPLIATVLGALYYCFEQLHYLMVRLGNLNQFTTKIKTHCNEDFDLLWEKSKSNKVITPEKSSAYLNWRFSNHPSKKIQFFCLYGTNNELLGYVAYSIHDKVVHIQDLQSINQQHIIDILLLKFSRHMRKDGNIIIRLVFLGSKAFETQLRKLLFFNGKNGSIAFAYFSPMCPQTMQEHILHKENWFLCGDFDI
jgi:hypothetical protein